MAKIKGGIEVITDKCKGCEICVISCPANVIEMSKEVNSKGYHYALPANMEQCTGCASCAIICPDGVITVYKTKI